MNEYLFIEDMDLLEAVDIIMNEAYTPHVKHIAAINKAIQEFKKLSYSEDKFKMFRKITFNAKLVEDDYARFVTNRAMSLSIARYDIENLRYDDDTDEDKLHDVLDLLQDIINEVNRKLTGFRLRIEEDKDLEGDIVIYKR